MIERTLFSPEHQAFRDSFRRFMAEEIAPFHAAWEEQGYVDKAVWAKAGALGFLCMTQAEDHGGFFNTTEPGPNNSAICRPWPAAPWWVRLP
jgi:alkylation response protein AidB-like acyl-CoA dehydrogenase